MIALLSIGLATMVVCLAFQALAAALAARYFASIAGRPLGPRPRWQVFRQFAILMLVVMLGNILQVLVWALLTTGCRPSPISKRRCIFPA
jgi:hypothetical protein